MSLLRPTPAEQMVDGHGRPYFLWDCDLTMEQFVALLHHDDPHIRSAMTAKLMRQARPEDVLLFVDRATLVAIEPAISAQLGDKAGFWAFWCDAWRKRGAQDAG